MSELSVMGVFEILPKLPQLIKRKNQVINDIINIYPDALITIDSPDFC
jgi:lipid-A-disaccharide synthase